MSAKRHTWVESRQSLVQVAAACCKLHTVERGSIVVRSVWAACLLIAGLNHVRVLVLHGPFWNYGGVHPISAAYLTGLTLLDPLVAALLFIKPKVGILATVVLIVTNVIHNLATTAHFAPAGEFLTRASHPIILSQIAFMLFVVATARIAWVGAVRRNLTSLR